jgi:hypothetical protein
MDPVIGFDGGDVERTTRIWEFSKKFVFLWEIAT